MDMAEWGYRPYTSKGILGICDQIVIIGEYETWSAAAGRAARANLSGTRSERCETW